jgi:hypothetical protein
VYHETCSLGDELDDLSEGGSDEEVFAVQGHGHLEERRILLALQVLGTYGEGFETNK